MCGIDFPHHGLFRFYFLHLNSIIKKSVKCLIFFDINYYIELKLLYMTEQVELTELSILLVCVNSYNAKIVIKLSF
jgi:hypothetical protein